jgi:acyl-CoA reductase-like NAD-dependent aldehyde dehydrogenase
MSLATVIDRERHYIGGDWVAPAAAGTIDVVDPATEEVIGRAAAGTAADVDAAVTAARDAFGPWAARPAAERAETCLAIGHRLEDRRGELADLITHEMGMPAALAGQIQVGLPIASFTSQPLLVTEVAWEERVGNSLVVREPVGVVGAIAPWNYPLHQIAAKVAAALAAGCTVVVKPSELTPLNAFVLAEIVEDAGVPPGVFNLVSGTGPMVGEAIAAHPGLDMVSFTGSTGTGRRVAELASFTVKRVALELGGKSAMVVLDDAPLARAVADGVAKCFLNSGQTCSALTRMIVPRALLPAAEEIAASVAASMPVGDPFDPRTKLGPLVSEAQRHRVLGYIRTGVDEGARLVCGGTEAPAGLDRGYYVRPTVLSAVTPAMTVAQEEIFGPVLAIMAHDGEDDAVAQANSTPYGLAGSVWSAGRERAESVARRLRTGQVDLNGAAFNPLAPFGGYGRSGYGRELGRHGLEEFLTVKSLQL